MNVPLIPGMPTAPFWPTPGWPGPWWPPTPCPLVGLLELPCYLPLF